MAFSPARRYSNSVKWLVSLLLIIAVWRFGVYGVDWKSTNGVISLLIVIAVLALCVSLWKTKK